MRTAFFKPKTPPPSPPRSQQSQTFSSQLMEENIDVAQSMISRWDPQDPTPLFTPSNSLEAKNFLRAISHLQSSMHFFISQDPSYHKLALAQTLTQTAMARLGLEFHRLLKSRPDPLPLSRHGSGSVSSEFEEETSVFSEEDDRSSSFPSPSRPETTDQVVSDLVSIAECMIRSGYGKDCTKIYKIIRKSITDESLYHLGIERLTSSQVQKMDWEILEGKIKNWLVAAKLAIKNVLYNERIFCDAVFSSSSGVKEACFSEVVSEGALCLFAFPENVAKCTKKSPEKLFRVLDLYEAVSELWPEIESIFEFESNSIIRSQSVNCRIKLGESARAILTDFEAAISKENSKACIMGGGVHPLTRYVMNYLSLLADYTVVLSDIVADWPLTTPSPLPEAYFRPEELDDSGEGLVSGNVSVRLAWLALVLLCNLDRKAKLYKDVALSYLFLANNLRYVISKARSSNLRFLLGEDWVVRHELKTKQYVSSYERMGWSKVLASLTMEEDTSLSKVTDRFKRFNVAFEEAYKRQSTWVVPDSKFRDEIKVSLARKIVPMYGEFYNKYSGVVIASGVRGAGGFGIPGEGIVRFAPDDLENYFSDLFYGANGGGGSASSISGLSAPSTSSSPSTTSSSGHSRGRRSP